MTQILPETSVYRVVDAALNRASEGLRVVEDYLRWVVGDRFLTDHLKDLRHELQIVARIFESHHLIESRDTRGDIGREIQTDSEYTRNCSLDLVRANFGRAQQALRTIEEFSKTFAVDVAERMERIRYDTYSAEKAVLTTLFGCDDIGSDLLYVLVDLGPNPHAFRETVSGLIDSGVPLIQLRDKSRNDRELIEAGVWLTESTRDKSTRWIMNDRPDLAVACRADGVHLGQADMGVDFARRIVGVSKLIGVSTHSLEQAQRAVLDGASYIGVGPVFSSTTKQFESLAGIEFVKKVVADISLPAFAIGGVTIHNVQQVIASGMNRVAVSSGVMDADDPVAAASQLLAKLQTAVAQPKTLNGSNG